MRLLSGLSRSTRSAPGGWLAWALCLALLAGAGNPARAQGGDSPAVLVARGDSLLARGDVSAARAQYEAARRLDDRAAAPLVGLGRAALAASDWRKAEDLFKAALDREPDLLDAHYYRAISLRELARHRTILQHLHWTGAERYFERVLARDSLYRDVLYQYALLRRYHDAYDRAIRLGETQIRLRPELAGPRIGLFKIYRSFLNHEGPEGALAWLRTHDSPYAAYFVGEAYRRLERFAEADSVFRALQEAPQGLPPQPILLSLARSAFAQERPEEGQAFFGRAVDLVEDSLGAAFVFEDLKYLLTDEELAAYRALDTPAAYRSFFRTFWAERDPMPGRAENVRLTEHYRRLRKAEAEYVYDGLRAWLNSPDRTNELEYPAAFRLNEEYNDKGLIFIRHGEPDDWIKTDLDDESWRYYSPDMDFHFALGETGGIENWRFIPVPAGVEALTAREIWGGTYSFLVRSRSGVEFYATLNELRDKSRANVMTGLSTDQHSWPEDLVVLDFPHLLSSFRAPDGETRLEIHYGLPAAPLAKAVPDSLRTLSLEVGYALHDTSWQTVATERTTRTLPREGAGPDVDFFTLTVPPDSYHVALHGRSLQQEKVLGGYRLAYRVPDLAGSELALSDLLPARTIRPATAPDRFNRGDLYVLPNPSGQFSRQEPLFVYFEIYNLGQEAAGLTRFTVEYTLRPVQEKRGFFGRLFGRGDRPVLTLRTERSGTEPSPAEHAEIDVRKVDPGHYTLTVKVTDAVRGGTVERSREIELRK